MTFADLMTLLMCFFVLMLSFSEMDVAKFKQLAGSMKEAFGVQTEVKVKNIPKGTSIIAKEFRPGAPKPTAMNTVRQFTINSNKNTLDVGQQKRVKKQQERAEQAQRNALKISEALKAEIDKGKVSVRTEGERTIVHILEQGTFRSGSAEIEPGFAPLLVKIKALLLEISGKITVAGHTDNVPIKNASYRSNWELSAARAASVTHELLVDGSIMPGRVMITGHGETQPRQPNDSAANRAMNRRIDITVVSGEDRHSSTSVLGEDASAGADTNTRESPQPG